MAAETTTAPTGKPGRYVGQPVKRVEDRRLLGGQARFVDDLALPGMMHAAFVRSPHPHARIAAIDGRRALELDGVFAVLTGSDLRDEMGPFVATGAARDEVVVAERHPLAIQTARYVGDPVAVVVATSPYIAEDARDLVAVEWEPLPVVMDPRTALDPEAPLLDPSLGTNNIAHIEHGVGDVDRAFAEADHVVTKEFVIARSTGASIETRGILAEYDGSGHLTIHTSSQIPHLYRMLLAPMLGMAEGHITVKVPEVGGGFGLKCNLFSEDAVIPALARRLCRPVKWIEDRYENLATAIHSKGMVCTMEIAADDDGRFLAFRAHYVTDSGGYSSVPFTPLTDSQCAGGMLPSCYSVQSASYVADNPLTNKCPIGAIRGVGWVPGQLARETLIDDLARKLGADPVELRLQNMISSKPHRSLFGLAYDGGSYAESLRLACETIRYPAFRERQQTLRAQGRYVGFGVSPFVEPTGWAAKSSRAGGLTTAYFDTAQVTMEPDGSVTVSTGLHSHGQGHETTFAQVTADELGVPIESVRIVYGDTDSSSFGMGTFASRSAVIGTGSIMNAAGEIRERLLGLAGTLLEASPDDIELISGRAQVKGAANRSIPIGEVAGFGYFGAEQRPDAVQRSGLTATAGYEPEETYANGCAAVVVEVDVATGEVVIEQLAAVEDCGVMLNPMIVRGQVSGAIAQGIGIALLEDLAYDTNGEFVSGSLLHYLFPTTGEVPMLQLRSIQTPSVTTRGGVKGVGEAGTIATPAAIVNAIADALSPFGVSLHRVPVTPAYVREVLRDADTPRPA